MCGIAGFLDRAHAVGSEELAVTVGAMARTLAHRGPDDEGIWVDAAAGVAFGHRRLAVIDLSADGHQPMLSADGRWVISFNGEIYNFARLRPELEECGHTFRGRSDTEVLLAAVSQWGVEGAARRANGMFAAALWDTAERELWLVRDRMGEKPLYYGWAGGAFLFASELKAFRRHPSFQAKVDRNALSLFLRYGYVPGPHCIFVGLSKLPPGCVLRLGTTDTAPRMWPYWSLHQVADAAVRSRIGAKDLLDEFEATLADAVALRMTADVPLGAFLSGGVDSSAVVALMQEQSPRPVRTFTIGFEEAGYDEAGAARAVAKYLGTDHTEVYLKPADALAVIPRLARMYDEPFGDSSQIPTCLVSELARAHVTVVLSGDGGDELLSGYDRYRWAQRLWRMQRMAPAAARLVARMAARRTPEEWDRLAARSAALLGRRPARVGERLHRLSGFVGATSALDLYDRLMTHWADPPIVGAAGSSIETGADGSTLVGPLADQLPYLDAIRYLPDDILAKVDRASMAVGLEARIPLLDHRIVELAWRIPPEEKMRHGRTKWPLRRLLARRLPEHLFARPKMGFGVPIGSWLRGPLRDWAECLLDERRLAEGGYLEPGPVREMWRRHLDGVGADHQLLWDVLMFQAWVEDLGESPQVFPG